MHFVMILFQQYFFFFLLAEARILSTIPWLQIFEGPGLVQRLNGHMLSNLYNEGSLAVKRKNRFIVIPTAFTATERRINS